MNVTRTAAVAAALLFASAWTLASDPTVADEATAGPPTSDSVHTSTAQDREHVALTVYNQNFGLVREVRRLPVSRGLVAVEFGDVAANLQTETVRVEAVGTSGRDFRVLEQNYRYDLLNPAKLLEKYLGRTVTLYRWNPELEREEALEAEVLATQGGTILRIGDEIVVNAPGRIAFPEIPEDLIARPTLMWLVDSDTDEARVDVSYLTGGLNWKSDYVMVLGADDAHAGLSGWVTLTNQSGATYQDAELKLVAGEVQRLPQGAAAPMMDEVRLAARSVMEQEFTEESFFEYHLYTLGRPTTVRQNEQKQVSLLSADRLAVQKRLTYFGAAHYFRSQYGSVESDRAVSVTLEFDNAEDNGMGMPLPSGVIRVYKDDGTGAQQFVGEDRIDHTPRDERVAVRLGEAFDVLGSRRQTDYQILGTCVSRSTWEVELRNHKDEAVQVRVVEPVGGDWNVIRSSHEADKVDQHTLAFDVDVPAREASTLRYTVRVRWC